MPPPLAYFLTWTCYGTWLHGDGRGSVEDEHNLPGEPYIAPGPRRAKWESLAAKHPVVELDEHARQIVTHAIQDHCRIRG
jgi:hypothetical protein